MGGIRVGKLVLKRNFTVFWAARRFLILIDGRRFDHIKVGETKQFYLEPGTHDVVLQVDCYQCGPLIVNVRENQTSSLLCGAVDLLSFLLRPSLWFKCSEQMFLKQDVSHSHALPIYQPEMTRKSIKL